MRVPIRPGCGSAYEKVERRVGDWAVAAVGACVRLDGGEVAEAGIGLAAVGADHFRQPPPRRGCSAARPTEEAFAAAGAAAAAGCHPTSDQRGPADYKRHLVEVLTVRALRRATARARGEEA